MLSFVRFLQKEFQTVVQPLISPKCYHTVTLFKLFSTFRFTVINEAIYPLMLAGTVPDSVILSSQSYEQLTCDYKEKLIPFLRPASLLSCVKSISVSFSTAVLPLQGSGYCRRL